MCRARHWSTLCERSLYIQQALIVGDGRKFVCALIVAHPENVARVAAQHGLAFSSYDELLLAPPVVALFREELESLQAEFSSFERVKRFCFLNEEALLDTELVTPTHESAPRGTGAEVCRMDPADVPAGRSPSHPAFRTGRVRRQL